MYKALYRQYRPINFNDVYGQETIVKTLQNSIKNSSYSHAYMFFGPRGTGKTSISKIFARSLNCLSPIDGNSCGECKNCVISYQKECVDIIEIDAASNNGVDEIRELKSKVSLVPGELKYKVYIIDEVHMLSIGAFNALLKTLEEPPEHVIFILATTDPQKVPETIISRCQCFSFKRISKENLTANLKRICEKEKISIDDNVIEEIAYASDGGMRDALSSLDQLRSYSDAHITLEDYANVNGSLTNDEIHNLFINIFSENYSEVLSSIKKYNDQGKNIISILEKLMRFMRDEIIKFYTQNISLQFDVKLIHKLVLKINENMFDIKKSSNPTVFIEMFLLEFMNNIRMDFQLFRNSCDEQSLNNVLKNEDENSSIIDKQTVDTVDNKQDSTDLLEEKKSQKNAEEINEQEIKQSFLDSNSNFNYSLPVIKNIEDIIKIRVNNTLAKANKQLLMNEISSLDKFNDYTFDQEIGYIACSILDAKIRAVSEDSIIISYEYDSIVKQNLLILNKITETYNRITNSNKKIAIITDKEWDEFRSKYIQDVKRGILLEVLEEPEEIFLETKKDDIISKNAIELFGDIVEIN